MQKNKETLYLLFCNSCCSPKEITKWIITNNWTRGISGEYCPNCQTFNELPDYLKKIANDLGK